MPIFVGIGTLVSNRNFQLLIRDFATLSSRQRERLIIFGDGPLRQELQALACFLDVADNVGLIGYRKVPYQYHEQAAAVVLSSRFETFGNVLVEATSCGTPAISTDCPFGPSGILADGHYGMRVPMEDPSSMADAMALTLTRPRHRAALMRRASEFFRCNCAAMPDTVRRANEAHRNMLCTKLNQMEDSVPRFGLT